MNLKDVLYSRVPSKVIEDLLKLREKQITLLEKALAEKTITEKIAQMTDSKHLSSSIYDVKMNLIHITPMSLRKWLEEILGKDSSKECLLDFLREEYDQLKNENTEGAK